MVVPYGDTDPMHVWKHVLDAGEASIGNCANSLTLGCDCLGEIHYLDHVTVKPDGSARLIEQAICIHEEDYGILWKHQDGHGQTTEVRRSRRLVVSSFHTVGNYEYGFYWYLYLDGRIQMEVKLTGIVGVSAVRDGEDRPEFAPLVAPNLASPIHQHLFCFRLDCEIDGDVNSVYEVDTVPVPVDDDNPDGTAFRAEARLLGTEHDAMRHVDPARSRSWKIVNPARKNRLGVPVAYRLVPESTPALLAAPGSEVAKRAGFRPLQPLGDTVRRRSPQCGRRPSEPRARRRSASVDRTEPERRGRGRRALAHRRLDAHTASGGLAGHARRILRFSRCSRSASSTAIPHSICHQLTIAPQIPRHDGANRARPHAAD